MEEKKQTSRWLSRDRLCSLGAMVLLFSGLFWSERVGHYGKGLVLLMWLGVSAALVSLLALTNYGKRFYIFVKAAKQELDKMVWPNRDETTKITTIVAVLVFVSAIVLWLLDLLLISILNFITQG